MAWKRIQFSRAELKQFETELRSFREVSKFLADENPGAEVVEALRNIGWNTWTVHDAGIAGRSDEVVWATARNENRVLLTTDEDFLDEQRFPIRQSPGVVILPALSASVDGFVTAHATALYFIGHHGEIWHATKASAGTDGTLTIRLIDFHGGGIKAGKFWFRDSGPPFVWENET